MAIPVISYSVYMHKNKFNGKIYIGVTKQVPERRFQNGYGYKYSNKRLWEDIKRYKWDGFEHCVLFFDLTKEQASMKEQALVEQYKSTDPERGYNQIGGGFRPYRPDISKVMKNRRGILCPNYGKKAPEQTRQALLRHSMYGQYGKNNPAAKAVLQFDKQGDLLTRFESIADAERELKVNSSHIVDCCKGRRKASNGYMWEYERSVDLSQYR